MAEDSAEAGAEDAVVSVDEDVTSIEEDVESDAAEEAADEDASWAMAPVARTAATAVVASNRRIILISLSSTLGRARAARCMAKAKRRTVS